MIKQLIKDIAYDNIQLSQALTRAKLIASEIKNETLKNWLGRELEGYDFDDPYLPKYRDVFSSVNLEVDLPFGRSQTIPVHVEGLSEEDLNLINRHLILEPISIVEEQVATLNTNKGYISLPVGQVQILASFYKNDLAKYGGVARSANREIGKVQYQNVLELTKQKLLDTLMELNEEFPDLNDNYKMTKENNERVQNIITTNIYGSNNPLNLATGENSQQTINQSVLLSSENEEKLKSLGIEQTEIDDLKNVLNNTNGQSDKMTGLMKWIGSVSATLAAKGLGDNLPQITEFVSNLIG